ncbi:MAG: helix-turn-helix domain-containing protein [Actinomycetia bacterium]|nr:helix-turn-helix domain-containing protein [Actinomycetes bacterium]
MDGEQHPVSQLHDVVHQRHRLGILAVLTEARRADFAYLKKTLSLTDGNLGRHLQVLEDAELVTSKRVLEGRRPRTWLRITAKGRRALDSELKIMNDLIRRVSHPKQD